MIYKGLGFLVVVWFVTSPTPYPLSRKEARPATHRKPEKETQLDDERGVEGMGQIIGPQ